MNKTLNLFVLAAFGLASAAAFGQAQQSPIPESPGLQPQIDVFGTGIATLDGGSGSHAYGAAGFATNSQINLSDSALAVGFSQRLYHGGIASFTAGVQSYDFTNVGQRSGLFTNQLFLDYQNRRLEAYIGRTDSPTGQIVQFPTLRGDDLVDFTTVPNPFSDGGNVEEHRTSNVAAVVFNQGLTEFANFHVQHLIDSSGAATGTALNSWGFSWMHEPPPGLEGLSTLANYGVGFEHRAVPQSMGGASSAIYGGGVVNLTRSMTHRLDLRLFDAYTFGSDTATLNSFAEANRADGNAVALSLRYLNSPFGSPSYTAALTAGYKRFSKIPGATEYALVLTGAKRLGDGFDAVAQIGWFHRNGALATLYGQKDSAVIQLGFSYSFDATINKSVGPRRSPMNMLFHYLPR